MLNGRTLGLASPRMGVGGANLTRPATGLPPAIKFPIPEAANSGPHDRSYRRNYRRNCEPFRLGRNGRGSFVNVR